MTNTKQKLFQQSIVGSPIDPKPETLELTRPGKNPAIEALRKLGGNTRSSSPKPKKEKH